MYHLLDLSLGCLYIYRGTRTETQVNPTVLEELVWFDLTHAISYLVLEHQGCTSYSEKNNQLG